MAEYLSVDWSVLRTRIGELLGYGRSSSGWTDGTGGTEDMVANIQDCIDDGYRLLINPPAALVDEGGRPRHHEWSWLIARTTVSTAADGYLIDLPAAFGNMVWPVTYNPDISRLRIANTPEAVIRDARQCSTTTGKPQIACVIPKQGVGATAQRWQLMVHPPADAIYVLNIQYSMQVAPLSTSAPYPVCGGQFGQILLEACLAVAEEDKLKIQGGPHRQKFDTLVAAAINLDRRQDGETLGVMHGTGVFAGSKRSGRTDGLYAPFDGTVYD